MDVGRDPRECLHAFFLCVTVLEVIGFTTTKTTFLLLLCMSLLRAG